VNESYTVRSLSPIRKMIAARTAEAKQTIPHFRLRADIEVDKLIALRQASGSSVTDGRVSMTDLLVKACAGALMETPALNIQWMAGEIRQMNSADISVVVALQDGVSTPIVRHADQKTIWEIARETKDLTSRARGNALRAEQIFGGSFSISNLGMYGIPEFDAIINPPQCAILAVGAARACVLPGTQSGTRIASVMRVTLSCDHRAVDGATGAAFLSCLRQQLEEPEHFQSASGGKG
jgi:pyruvate dehydrogenase E2 component (dihydrolipoamide acetyltransferase)